jgi:5-(carboxyamino)imidazole ribonucleotide synthase
MNQINSQTILGILGSGQLARMTSIAASDLGIHTHIYCSESGISPAEHVATKTVKGESNNLESILNFCKNCDYVTLENEFIDQSILEEIDNKYPHKLFPNSQTFKKIGDKISEKKNFELAGLKVAPYLEVKTVKDVENFALTNGFPVVLKSSKGGYDGYGNITLHSSADIIQKFENLKGDLLVEAFIPYEKELAILVARNSNEEMVYYPIAHTIQENHICHFVNVPADISFEISEKIKLAAKVAMTSINAVGIFAFEFFLTKSGELYLNESAPRPHNSGHYTIEGCTTSQFQNHVRSVLNLPLGEANLRSPFVVMLNLLGTQNNIATLKPINSFLKIKDGHLHLYGKKDSKVGRKMGHFTLLGNNQNEMMDRLKKLKMEYSI